MTKIGTLITNNRKTDIQNMTIRNIRDNVKQTETT